MSTEKDKFDPEAYLVFHYGRKEQYPMSTTIAAMAAFSQMAVREIINPVLAEESKTLRQFFQVETHDILYTAACDLKTRWLAEGVITPSQSDLFGAFDIWVELMQGVPEDLIKPGMFVPGYSSDQDDKFKQN